VVACSDRHEATREWGRGRTVSPVQDSGIGITAEIPDFVKRNDYRLVLLQSDLDDVLEKCLAASVVALDTETSGLDPIKDFFAGVSLSWGETHAVYIPVAHVAGPNADTEAVKALVLAITEKKTVVYHNAAFDIERLRRWWGLDVQYKNYHDTQAMCFRLDASFTTKLKLNVEKYLGFKPIDLDDLFGKNDPQFHLLDVDTAVWYAAADADNTLRLFNLLYPRVLKRFKIPYQVDRKLIPIVAKHNMDGVLVDVPYLKEAEAKYEELRQGAIAELREVSGNKDFNPNATAQVRKLLYDTLKLPVLGFTDKTKQPSTDKKVLARLKSKHPAVATVIASKSFGKFGGYCKGFREAARILDQELYDKYGLARILPSYHIFTVPTGRAACSDPNLQQIPRPREEEGWEEAPSIRAAFKPRPGYFFLEADYSQIEVRVFAAESGAQAFLNAFKEGRDVHAETAALMKRKPLDQVTKAERQQAKTVNFGMLYGQGPPGLAETLSISEEEAAELQAEYFSAIPEARIFMERTHEQTRINGGISTKYGHFRPLPDIRSRDKFLRAEAERQSVNTVVQGTAADVLKFALIRIDELVLSKWGETVREVFTTHDSVLFEVKDGTDVAQLVADLKHAMEIKIENYPAMLVEVKMGKDYGNLQELEDGEPCVQPVVEAVTEGQPEEAATGAVTELVLLRAEQMDVDTARRFAAVLKKFHGGQAKLRMEYGEKVLEIPEGYTWGEPMRVELAMMGVTPVEEAPVTVSTLKDLFK
jgi:DNA polymerase I